MDIHRTALFLFFLWGILGHFWGTMLKTGTFCVFFAYFSPILTISYGFESLIVHQQRRRTLCTSFLFFRVGTRTRKRVRASRKATVSVFFFGIKRLLLLVTCIYFIKEYSPLLKIEIKSWLVFISRWVQIPPFAKCIGL